jgi:DNA-binding NarL/FixJ family response regulator
MCKQFVIHLSSAQGLLQADVQLTDSCASWSATTLKILAVDDHPLIRDALRQVLKVLDPELMLVSAANAHETLVTAAEQPDLNLVLLDLSLPDGNGFDVLRELRDKHPAIPVVVLSATDDAASVMRALDEGAMGYIPKTASNDVLLGALRLVLGGGVYLPAEVLRQQDRHHSHDSVTHDTPQREVSCRDLGLTERQAQVLALMVQGKPNKLICRALNLAEGTVKIHISAILRALNVTNRTQAVVAVGKLGLKLSAP